MKFPKQMNKVGNTTALETGLFFFDLSSSIFSKYKYV